MSIQLRNWTYTRDIRLDRLRQFDPRSRDFPITAAVEDKTLRSMSYAINDRFNQLREGMCVSIGIGHKLAARPAMVEGLSTGDSGENLVARL